MCDWMETMYEKHTEGAKREILEEVDLDDWVQEALFDIRDTGLTPMPPAWREERESK